jgi:uncharacterized membrane protein
MNKHVTDIVSYLSWPGLLIAFFAGDRYASRFHLNQSLVIWLAATLISVTGRWLPLFGWLVGMVGGLFCALCWFIGIINAIQGVEKEVPLLGQIKIL